jgi:D-lyxose ketol-isomerase
MLSRSELDSTRAGSLDYFQLAGIALPDDETRRIEIADLGLGQPAQPGLELITYVNTARVCAKELVLFPGQTCPEHRRPPTPATGPGKEETFRCRWGLVYLYMPGQPAATPLAQPPAHRRAHYTVWHEVALRPGEQ